jgi:hypothetical protein
MDYNNGTQTQMLPTDSSKQDGEKVTVWITLRKHLQKHYSYKSMSSEQNTRQ